MCHVNKVQPSVKCYAVYWGGVWGWGERDRGLVYALNQAFKVLGPLSNFLDTIKNTSFI